MKIKKWRGGTGKALGTRDSRWYRVLVQYSPLSSQQRTVHEYRFKEEFRTYKAPYAVATVYVL